ncbi:class I SAM-dependent methyltransferase [Stackebrandtia nassauensis]|uniref:Methyltransferase type 11 n=1 Tax=Stackebrandtia nassauensis (strain DSM 44728 / CIP 108903 / NRRL B-16338 / NBRC 102104 / LLR-40K-21) TaxID=446470 RepID=D3Q138_STANL|nr:methyltransferase domain-containing protein [Stackebrandtia nassauensis]ADD43788.1 Methyltransferase type 11 [Stackebrandtia nassauensis DSM 44728]
MSTKDYIFDTGSELGEKHVEYLEKMLDGPTTMVLSSLDIQPGQRCLEVGFGGGSIARWMSDRVGPTGKVVALDLDIDHLEPRPNLEVLSHDINEGLPASAQGPYDVIHARQVLMHLPQREAIFKHLVDSLAPGGWLVIGDMTDRERTVKAAPSQADKELWDKIQHMNHHLVGKPRGMNFEWTHEVDGHMASAGLTNIQGLEYSQVTKGGGNAMMLHRNLNIQAAPLLLQAGATQEELDRYRELTLDPGFRAWFFQIIYTWGQKAA